MMTRLPRRMSANRTDAVRMAHDVGPFIGPQLRKHGHHGRTWPNMADWAQDPAPLQWHPFVVLLRGRCLSRLITLRCQAL
jgi:hypothetical protein